MPAACTACQIMCLHRLSDNVLAPLPACLSESLLAARQSCQNQPDMLACRSACYSDPVPATGLYSSCLHDSEPSAGPAYQILSLQLGLFISFYACSWACLSDYMPAAGPVYQILYQQLGLLIRFYASSWAC
jgi:hypothetical protein